MEQDKHLKEILLNSADGASRHFTEAVMNKVNGLTGALANYQPLVSPKWQRFFLFAFGGLVMAICSLCFLMASSQLHIVTWMKNINIPDFSYNKVLMFIFIFWVVFSANALLQKRFFHYQENIPKGF